jgi:hypothetical protein
MFTDVSEERGVNSLQSRHVFAMKMEAALSSEASVRGFIVTGVGTSGATVLVMVRLPECTWRAGASCQHAVVLVCVTGIVHFWTAICFV